MTRGGVVPGRQLSELRLGTSSDLRDGSDPDWRWLQEDFDDSDAIERLRLDVFDVVYDRRHVPFGHTDDAVVMSLGTRRSSR